MAFSLQKLWGNLLGSMQSVSGMIWKWTQVIQVRYK